MWTSVTRETVGESFNLARDAETPAFTGRDQPDDSSAESDSDAKREREEENEARLIEEELKADAKRFLDKITSTPKGRKLVIRWLWTLVPLPTSPLPPSFRTG